MGANNESWYRSENGFENKILKLDILRRKL
jgi:hypothetical protein